MEGFNYEKFLKTIATIMERKTNTTITCTYTRKDGAKECTD